MEWGRKPRGLGAWYVTEHMVRAMRAYGWTIIVGALGQPIIYLLGLAVGLAALIDAPIDDGGIEVSYLVFVAPALLMTADDRGRERGVHLSRHGRVQVASLLLRLQRVADRDRADRQRACVLGASARMVVVAVAYYLFLYLFGAVPGVLVRLDHDLRRRCSRDCPSACR